MVLFTGVDLMMSGESRILGLGNSFDPYQRVIRAIRKIQIWLFQKTERKNGCSFSVLNIHHETNPAYDKFISTFIEQ